MAREKTPMKKAVKKVSKKATKKKLAKKTTSKAPQGKKIIENPKPKSNLLEKKKRRIIYNLVGFLVLLILSLVLYSVANNYLVEVILLMGIILFLIITIALFLALISVLIAKKSKRKA
jgi:predicted histidine transporter YuiF (NhaC family)